MPATLTVRDETTAGQQTNELTLDFLTERITVRELIRSRVHQEVKDHNLQKAQIVFRGLVKPTDAEEQLNGYKLRQPRRLDWHKQFDAALEGFQNNGVLILIDDKQAESLDQEIVIRHDTKVTFLKLVPLVGG